MNMLDKIILHVDLNNFYATVEQVLNPDLIGKPIAVCGDPDKRHGIVLAKSNLAKKYGVQTAEPIWQAKRKCPDLVIVPPTYGEYVKYSKMVRDIYVKYTSQVESFGLDECWLDVTGSTKLFGSGVEIAEKIRKEVKEVTGGLTVSIGVSFTKVFAKLGSDLKKPDAVSVISRENYKDIAWSLPASDMLYVGRSTANKLKEFNIRTIGDLAKANKSFLIREFGKIGESMHDSANGLNDEPVHLYTYKRVPESIGNGTTTSQDIRTLGEATSLIYSLCEMIAFRLRTNGMVGEGVSINLRDVDLISHTKQGLLSYPTSSSDLIAKKALLLLKSSYDFSSKKPIRMLTINVFKLSQGSDTIQFNMLQNESEKVEKLDNTIDKLREKFGYNVLQRALNVGSIYTCDSRELDDDFIPFKKD